jgi:cytochrome oxidase assembly protein ShyY1
MLGLLALTLVLMAVMSGLGVWQLGVARDNGRVEAMQEARSRPVAPLTDVVGPHEQFPDNGSLRRVTATGHYDPSGQVLVAPRRLHGHTGAWVVTPLVVDGTGARLAVVRGFVDGPVATPPAVPTGTVTVTGALAPSEEPSDPGRPADRLSTVDLPLLLDRWGGSIYNAFVFAIDEAPASGTQTDASAGLQRIPPPRPEAGLDLRNAGYALQWWVFAAFVGYMYVRILRDEHRSHTEPGPDDPATEPTTNERAHV